MYACRNRNILVLSETEKTELRGARSTLSVNLLHFFFDNSVNLLHVETFVSNIK